jgi:hypothetical protein
MRLPGFLFAASAKFFTLYAVPEDVMNRSK